MNYSDALEACKKSWSTKYCPVVDAVCRQDCVCFKKAEPVFLIHDAWTVGSPKCTYKDIDRGINNGIHDT